MARDRSVMDEATPTDDGRRASLTAMIAEDPDRLRRRSLSLGVPRDDADDVAQTALMRAWRSIEKLEKPEPGQMCSWLDAIARNAATDLARQRSKRPIATLDDDTPDAQNVVRDVEMRVILDSALKALHGLPALLREPLILATVDELSTHEIAERLGIKPATVRQRITRARKALAACRRSGMSEDADLTGTGTAAD